MAFVLVLGGVAYLAVFFWITVVRVREIEAETKSAPAQNPGHADEHQVGEKGVEPSRVAPPDPKSGASASSATRPL